MIGLHDIPKEITKETFVITPNLRIALAAFRGHFPRLALRLVEQMGTPFLFYERDTGGQGLWLDENTQNWITHIRYRQGAYPCSMCRDVFDVDDIINNEGFKIVVVKDL